MAVRAFVLIRSQIYTEHGTDVAVCVFEPSIVDRFCRPPITPEPINFLPQFFEPLDRIPTVASVIEEMESSFLPEDVLRRHVLIGLTESKVGKYSMLHENAIYRFGYAHKDTIRLAYMYVHRLQYFCVGS